MTKKVEAAKKKKPTMSELVRRYKTNETKETEGVWHTPLDFLGQGDDVPKVLLARYGGSNSIRLARAMANLSSDEQDAVTEAHALPRGSKERDEVSDELRLLSMRVFYETSMLDWRNFVDDDGEDVPISLEAALTVFAEIPQFFDELFLMSVSKKPYRDDVEGAAKN